MLVQSLMRFGQPKPILVRKANNMIIAGHGLWEACRRAGMREVVVQLWDVDQKTADAFLLADNRLATMGMDEPTLVAQLLQEQAADAYAALGFSATEAQKLIDRLAGEQLAVEELLNIQTTDVRDKFWISVRGSLAYQAYVLKVLQAVAAKYDGVEIIQGTVQTLS
jgi:ParB-like chromosome segregation protein Spo0J